MQIQFKHTSLALMMAAAAFFASCEPQIENPVASIFVTKGAIVLNSGNARNGVDGSITFIDFNTEQAEQSVFRKANGISLGCSLNDLIAHEDKIYVLDGGYFDDSMVQKGTGLYLAENGDAKKLAPDALVMSAFGYSILYYHKSEAGDPGYSVLDTRSNSVLGFNFKGDDLNPIAEPGAMAIDPNTSNIMLASSPEGDDDIDPCHVNLYTGEGQFLKSFPAGVCPKRIVFLYGSPYE